MRQSPSSSPLSASGMPGRPPGSESGINESHHRSPLLAISSREDCGFSRPMSRQTPRYMALTRSLLKSETSLLRTTALIMRACSRALTSPITFSLCPKRSKIDLIGPLFLFNSIYFYPDRREMLLDGRGRLPALQLFDVGGHVHRQHSGEAGNAMRPVCSGCGC